MTELEDRLRETVARAAAAFGPTPDLSERIAARVQARRRARRRAAAGVAAGLLVAAGVGGLALRGDGRDGRVDVGDRGTTSVPTTSSPPSTTPPQTTSVPGTASTTVGPPPSPPVRSVGADTPLDRGGAGAIRVGMTLRQVAALVGAEVVVPTNWAEQAGGECFYGRVGGSSEAGQGPLELMARGPAPTDPLDGVVARVDGHTTVEGVQLGTPLADVLRVYGEPTARYPGVDGDEILVFEAAGVAYGVSTDGRVVLGLRSGLPDAVALGEGCS